MNIFHYLQKVGGQIRSKEARNLIKTELEQHLIKSVNDLMKGGLSREEAERIATTQMGDPVKIGMKFNRLYRPKIDWVLIGVFCLLIGLSLIPFLFIETIGDKLVERKAVYSIIGLFLAFACMIFDYRKLKKFSTVLMWGSFMFLLIISLSPHMINGTPYISFLNIRIGSQDLLPLLLIAWAGLLAVKKNFWTLSFYFVAGLILLNFSSENFALLLLYIVFVFAMIGASSSSAGEKLKFYIVQSLFALMMFFIEFLRNPYMVGRMKAFLQPDQNSESEGYIYLAVKKLMAAAQMFGRPSAEGGFLLPEGNTDFIFGSLTYHFGWAFSVLLIFLLSFLSWRMFSNARKCHDLFGKLLIAGAAALYTFSFSWNILMSFGIVPILSLSLTFFSYGLMPVIFHSFLVGLVLSVYRRKNFVPKQARTEGKPIGK